MTTRSADLITGLKIITGGQSGVDRAALDTALELGLDCGGWCPKARRAEDGPIADCYPLTETESENYETRTRRNVHDADGIMILTARLPLSGGSELTHRLALQLKKPVLIIGLDETNSEATRNWLAYHRIRILNIAGPRESEQPGIYDSSKAFLYSLLS